MTHHVCITTQNLSDHFQSHSIDFNLKVHVGEELDLPNS